MRAEAAKRKLTRQRKKQCWVGETRGMKSRRKNREDGFQGFCAPDEFESM